MKPWGRKSNFQNHTSIIKEIKIDGLNVKIEVNSDNHGGWILEIVDEQSNSTLMEEIYPSAERAIQAGVRAIKTGE